MEIWEQLLAYIGIVLILFVIILFFMLKCNLGWFKRTFPEPTERVKETMKKMEEL